jgi:DNA-binding MarR family transcriptional regulator
MAKKTSKGEYEALATFRYVLRQFLRFSEEAASSVGLTPQQHQALLAIRGYPGRDSILIGELAERLQIRHHSVVGLIDRLVSLGLVAREQGTGDRRQVFVMLTDAGADLLERLSTAHRGELRRIGPQIIQQMEQLVEMVGGAALEGKGSAASSNKKNAASAARAGAKKK